MAHRLRPARVADVVDGAKMRAQLTAAALDHIGNEAATRAEALELLKRALFRGQMIAKERLEMGAGGRETATLLSGVADEIVAALYDFTTVHVFRARNPTEGERLAIIAVGGYGRGELAPSSDWDLLFLRPYKQTPWAESVTEYMLYMLWDMGLKVGHASRTADECVKLAREDHTIQTALLEARFVAGDEALSGDLTRRFAAEILEGDPSDFIAAKLKERDERHARGGGSRFLVEPNVKESKGGLRDLHTLFWILRRAYGGAVIGDYVKAGVFTNAEALTFVNASDFFWRVRCHLHFLTGRAEERLTFDVQPELAARLGYGSRDRMPGVERFMKRYFLAARDVGMLTRVLAAKLEAAQQARGVAGLSRFIPTLRRHGLPEGFIMEAGRVTLKAATVLDKDPANLLRIFALADARDADVHPSAMHQITRRLKAINADVRRAPAAQAAFLSVAASERNPGRSLRRMNAAGVLGRFLPEFGRIVGQMQFNMYHHYTVDEHTLRAVEVISDIEKGVCAEEHPLATAIFPKIVNRRALYLAMLLHDTGKGVGDQQEEGAKTARAACTRLGLPTEESELVAWLVRRHLLMSDVAQKRDLGDPRTVAQFAAEVGTIERLRLLLVLTIADIKAVGPGIWNGWKAQLLRELYRLTEAAFHGGRTDEAAIAVRLAGQAAEIRAELTAPLASDERVARWAARLEDSYWLAFDRSAIAWHLETAAAAFARTGKFDGIEVAARPRSAKEATELLVHAPDRPGLFAGLAKAIAASGADILDARIHTTADGAAFDVFSLLDVEGRPYGAEDPWSLDKLLDRVRKAAAGAEVAPLTRRTAPRRAAAFAIEPWVVFDNAISANATVVEVSGRDRPGLLADLAHVFAEAAVSIASAHIDNYGARAADAFYVVAKDGGKITDDAALATLKAQLIAVLREQEPEAPADPARKKLAVAPASEAR